MPSVFRSASQIPFNDAVAIQFGSTAGNALGNNIPSDAGLVCENGLWKYPQLASAGAIVVTAPCRLVRVSANLGASLAWTLVHAGNPSNTTDTPYPSGSATLYDEPTVQIAAGTSQYVSIESPSTALPYLSPGQRVYMTCAAGATRVTFYFVPLR